MEKDKVAKRISAAKLALKVSKKPLNCLCKMLLLFVIEWSLDNLVTCLSPSGNLPS